MKEQQTIIAFKIDEIVAEKVKSFCRQRGIKYGFFIEKAIVAQMERESLKENLVDVKTMRELENRAVHLMAVDGKRVAGVARLHFNEPGVAQFRYMGVDHRYRHRGIATRLLRGLERRARKRGATIAWFNAREPAVPFYEKYGYAIFDISYTLYGCIPHWKMMKEL